MKEFDPQAMIDRPSNLGQSQQLQNLVPKTLHVSYDLEH